MKPLRVTRQKLDPSIALDAAKSAVTELTRLIQPVRIFLFGSAVQGTFSQHSDLDLLVVCSDGEHLRSCQKSSARFQPHLPFHVEIVWTTLSEFERKKNLGGVCMEANQQGILLFNK